MCGIVGMFSTLDAVALRAGLDAISHRGPDGSGVYLDPIIGLALGHVRLSIQDLSPNGAQPMRSGDGAVVLVFNGEIYNFRELRAELVAQFARSGVRRRHRRNAPKAPWSG